MRRAGFIKQLDTHLIAIQEAAEQNKPEVMAEHYREYIELVDTYYYEADVKELKDMDLGSIELPELEQLKEHIMADIYENYTDMGILEAVAEKDAEVEAEEFIRYIYMAAEVLAEEPITNSDLHVRHINGMCIDGYLKTNAGKSVYLTVRKLNCLKDDINQYGFLVY